MLNHQSRTHWHPGNEKDGVAMRAYVGGWRTPSVCRMQNYMSTRDFQARRYGFMLTHRTTFCSPSQLRANHVRHLAFRIRCFRITSTIKTPLFTAHFILLLLYHRYPQLPLWRLARHSTQLHPWHDMPQPGNLMSTSSMEARPETTATRSGA